MIVVDCICTLSFIFVFLDVFCLITHAVFEDLHACKLG